MQDESTVYEIQRPATFSTFSIPFELEGDTEVRGHILIEWNRTD